mgnify:CR=1 FL=1
MDVIVMTGIFLAGSVTDLVEYRISNRLILCGWIAGLCWRMIRGGPAQMLAGAGCIALAVLVAWPLFCLRGVGAGDIKMVSIAACFYGMRFTAKMTALWIVLAGMYSFLKLLRERMLLKRLRYFCRYLVFGRGAAYYLPDRDGRSVVISLVPFLAVAYYMSYLLWWDGR